MPLFKDILGSGESLFKNELALDYSFQPKVIPYREGEMRQIAAAMKPLFQKRNGRNIFVFGPSGVGKTAALRHLLDELEEQTEEIVPFYINCWTKDSPFKMLLEMCDVVGYKFTQNKRTDELFSIVKGLINKKAAAFVFDEVDKLEDIDIIYNLIEEVYNKSIILVTNYKDWLAELDPRIRSRLMPEVLEFRAYNLSETRGILKQRMEYAFIAGVFDDDAFELVVQKTFGLGDIRCGLYLMKEAALIAEDRAAKKVTAADVESATKKISEFTVKKTDELDEEVKFILELIKQNNGKKIGELFQLYREAGGQMLYKSFQRRINKLDDDKFITTKKMYGGAEGKTTIIHFGPEKKLTEF